jgi:UDP-3-O-[3-hydroxymyristoyl] glucosamine N-acyltransferase
MMISDLKTVLPAGSEIVRDSCFDSMGFIWHGKINQFVFIESEHYIKELKKQEYISAVITTKELSDQIPKGPGLIISKNPKKDYYDIHNYLVTDTNFYPNPLFPKYGNNILVGVGTVIGCDGFAFNKYEDGKIQGVRHGGGVVIGDGVEIQSNCTIERGIFGDDTIIGENTKIASGNFIGHNCVIGKRVIIAAGSCFGGFTTVGDDVKFGHHTTIKDQITIGEKAWVVMGSVVTQNVRAGQVVSGNFAIDHRRTIENIRRIR